MGCNDAPAMRKSNPCLALPAALTAALEFQGDAGKVFTETHDIQSCYGAGKIRCWARFAKLADFFMSIKILGGAKAHYTGIGPKHFHQFFHIICDQSALGVWIEVAKLGNNVRVVDDHESETVSVEEGFAC